MTNLEYAIYYRDRGISVMPQIPGEKRPAMAWKPYQECQPEIEVVHRWFSIRPDAGVFAVLGPGVSQ